jgi:hypothetical protein
MKQAPCMGTGCGSIPPSNMASRCKGINFKQAPPLGGAIAVCVKRKGWLWVQLARGNSPHAKWPWPRDGLGLEDVNRNQRAVCKEKRFWRHNKEQSGVTGWVEHVARMRRWQMCTNCWLEISAGRKHSEEISKYEDGEIGFKVVDWFNLAHDRDQWRYVNIVTDEDGCLLGCCEVQSDSHRSFRCPFFFVTNATA